MVESFQSDWTSSVSTPPLALRMDEGDHVAAKATTGFGIDELGSCLAQLRERRREVVNFERDMVKAGAAPLQEPRDRAIGIDGLDELDMTRAPRPSETASTPWSLSTSRVSMDIP